MAEVDCNLVGPMIICLGLSSIHARARCLLMPGLCDPRSLSIFWLTPECCIPLDPGHGVLLIPRHGVPLTPVRGVC